MVAAVVEYCMSVHLYLFNGWSFSSNNATYFIEGLTGNRFRGNVGGGGAAV